MSQAAGLLEGLPALHDVTSVWRTAPIQWLACGPPKQGEDEPHGKSALLLPLAQLCAFSLLAPPVHCHNARLGCCCLLPWDQQGDVLDQKCHGLHIKLMPVDEAGLECMAPRIYLALTI